MSPISNQRLYSFHNGMYLEKGKAYILRPESFFGISDSANIRCLNAYVKQGEFT